MIYLACPYSHENKEVEFARFHAVNIVAGALINNGERVYSPISHSHAIRQHCPQFPGSWDFWGPYDTHFIGLSEGIKVLMIDGWEESTGVTAEIRIADELGISITYLPPAVYGLQYVFPYVTEELVSGH